jgi:hypothetical protein
MAGLTLGTEAGIEPQLGVARGAEQCARGCELSFGVTAAKVPPHQKIRSWEPGCLLHRLSPPLATTIETAKPTAKRSG